jgi:hypothetical protein
MSRWPANTVVPGVERAPNPVRVSYVRNAYKKALGAASGIRNGIGECVDRRSDEISWGEVCAGRNPSGVENLDSSPGCRAIRRGEMPALVDKSEVSAGLGNTSVKRRASAVRSARNDVLGLK